jgi:DNA-binding MarR family transcriptional regulator
MARRNSKSVKIDEVLDAFRRTGNADAAFDNLAARRLGLNPTDLQCLSIVQRRDGLTAGTLGAEAGLTSGAVTGVVDRLERAGYARRVRDPSDRRKVKVEVTEAFMAAGAEIWGPVKADWDAELARRFTGEQLDVVLDFLRTTGELTARHAARLES